MSNFLMRYLRSKLQSQEAPRENEAVFVHIANEDLDAAIALQLRLGKELDHSDVGRFDGNEVGGGELVLFMYGPDAERLVRFVEPILRASECCKGAKVVVRWGGFDAPQREFVIGSEAAQ